MRVLALSGSLRSESTNSRLLRSAAELAPKMMQFTFYDRQLALMPPFSPDLDAEGAGPAPLQVGAFRQLIRDADAVLISCPEYAHGVPGAFKNALDWVVSSGELGGKPLAVLMASPSGAPFARAALLPTLNVLEARMVFESSLVLARKDFTADGHLANPQLAATLREVLLALAAAASL